MRMNRLSVSVLLLMLILPSRVFAQRSAGALDGAITGYVVDDEFQKPIEYANIVLYRQIDSAQVTGTITRPDGYFRLADIPADVYYVEISFIGYETHTIDNLHITPATSALDLGNISLAQTIISVEGTEVVAERPELTFQIDKKVINVSRQTAVISGTAVDVLENVPSVNVDIEGNVSLRGSENFTVLIDGRPTVLEPSEALQQIPASTIESIEIITNPSAKYDPDGVSGIINVIMKKKRLRGASGIANLNLGLDDKYGGDFLVNYRRGMWNVYGGVDYNNQVFSGTRKVENMTFRNDTTSYIFSNGDMRHRWNPYGLRGGIELTLGSQDKLNLGGRYGARAMDNSFELDYNEWSEPGNGNNLYTSQEDGDHSHIFYALMLDYLHQFSKRDHSISLQTFFSRRNGDELSTTDLLDTAGVIINGQRNTEEGPSTRMQLKLDYKLPLRQNDKFEAGYQTRANRSEDVYKMYEYDSSTGEYTFMPQFSHASEYSRTIHSLYSLYSGELGSFGYQGGLRGEYMYRTVDLVGEEERFTIDRWDYFPTAHISYQLPYGQQLMASYTRRIDRPRQWWLEPFITWSDAYNVRTGNPALKPEYIDSYELGYQLSLGKSLFSSEAYYRVTHNKVERVRSVYGENVIMHTVENVGTDYARGVEFMLDLNQLKWWNINIMTNLYDYRIEGNLYGEDFSEEDFNWSIRLNNEFKLLKSTKIQINGRYRSPAISAQGQREGFFTADAALRQEFLEKRLSVTLQLRDILSTGRREYRSEGEDFYYYSSFDRKSPMVMLTITYNFNNYRPERRRDDNGEEFEGMEDFN